MARIQIKFETVEDPEAGFMIAKDSEAMMIRTRRSDGLRTLEEIPAKHLRVNDEVCCLGIGTPSRRVLSVKTVDSKG